MNLLQQKFSNLLCTKNNVCLCNLIPPEYEPPTEKRTNPFYRANCDIFLINVGCPLPLQSTISKTPKAIRLPFTVHSRSSPRARPSNIRPPANFAVPRGEFIKRASRSFPHKTKSRFAKNKTIAKVERIKKAHLTVERRISESSGGGRRFT